MVKRIATAALAIFLLSVLLSVPALAIVAKTPEFYVADYAGVLKESTKQEIIDYNGYLEHSMNGAQIVVVTVEYMDGMYSDEYALKVMNEWGVGSSKYNNGMVLAFATKENRGWLATGDGIDDYFTDDMANRYMDSYFWNDYDAGKYDKAVNNLFSHLVSWYEKHYNTEMAQKPKSQPQQNNSYNNSGSGFWDSSVLQTVVVVLIFLAIKFLIDLVRAHRDFVDYYTRKKMTVPTFHIWNVWQGPHIYRYTNDDYRSPRRRGFGGGGGGGGGGGDSFFSSENYDSDYSSGSSWSSSDSGSSWGGGGGYSGYGGGSGSGGGGFGGGGGGGRR